jgi:hypothetical protein
LADENSSVPRSTNNTIINNLIYNTDFDAYSWTQVANSGLINTLIAYNTIVDGNLNTGAGGNPAIVNVNSQIRNNIVLGTNSSVPSKTGITFSNNNWAFTPALAKSTTDIVGNPQIARTGTTTPGTLTGDYFKVSATSPVIGAAITINGVVDDFFKTSRTTAPEIGGYEFLSSSTPPVVTPPVVTPPVVTPPVVTPPVVTPPVVTPPVVTPPVVTPPVVTPPVVTPPVVTPPVVTPPVVTPPVSTSGTTYYVSPTGVDTNNGKLLTTPVKTINAALNKATVAGDIVYVMTGTYVEAVTVNQSGITLSAYPNNNPVIDGASTLPSADWGDLISVVGNNNAISGFEVKNSNVNGAHMGGYGIQVTGHHNTISKMNVHHAWEQGIIVNGDYNTIEDSTIWQNARSNSVNPGLSASGWGTGISAARNQSAAAIKPGITSYATLRRNTVFNNWGEGISCFEADHCTMEDNVSYDNWTINLYLSDSTNSLVQRNMIYVSSASAIPTRNNSHPGLLLADEVSTVPRSTNNTIINNFIYNANFSIFSWTGVAKSGLNNTLIANNTIVDGSVNTGSGGNPAIVNVNSQIRNNIILGTTSVVPSKTGITFSNNNWAFTPATAKSSTDVVGNPQIARTGTTKPGTLTSAYFKILTTSPVINRAATSAVVKEDFFKTVRGATAPDIGGHEAR